MQPLKPTQKPFINLLKGFALLVFLAFIASCGNGSTSPGTTHTLSFKDDTQQKVIAKGDTLNLSWRIEGTNTNSQFPTGCNFRSKVINQSPESKTVDCDDSRVLTPSKTTTYSISYLDQASDEIKEQLITAIVESSTVPAQILSFVTDKISIESGESVNLNWQASDAITCVLQSNGVSTDPSGVTEVNCQGSSDFAPGEKTLYQFSALGQNAVWVSETVTIDVTEAQPVQEAKIDYFREKNGRLIITQGESVTLEWQGQPSCSLAIDTTATPSDGEAVDCKAERSDSPDVSTYYTFKSQNEKGISVTQTLFIEVNEAAGTDPEITQFSVSPSTITRGESVTISWDVSNATGFSCQLLANAAILSTDCKAEISHTPSLNTTYTLDVKDSSSTLDSESRAVTVLEPCSVSFADSKLEEAIREALDKSTGTLSCEDVESLSELSARAKGISDLSGIEKLTSLTDIDLRSNSIVSLSPLADLKQLINLDLVSNQISDLEPLAELINLEEIRIWDNKISQLEPLTKLDNLRLLYIGENDISDITDLGEITSLEELILWTNTVTDISVLSMLTNLRFLDLGRNLVSDISPLVDNSGLSSGDTIWMPENCLDLSSGSDDAMNIAKLRERGVTFQHGTQKTCL